MPNQDDGTSRTPGHRAPYETRRRPAPPWETMVAVAAVLALIAFSARTAAGTHAPAAPVIVDGPACHELQGGLVLPPGHPPISGLHALPPGHPPVDVGPDGLPPMRWLPPGHPPIGDAAEEGPAFPPGFMIEI